MAKLALFREQWTHLSHLSSCGTPGLVLICHPIIQDQNRIDRDCVSTASVFHALYFMLEIVRFTFEIITY
jgi:hypothetical protein